MLEENSWHSMAGHGGLPRSGKQAQILQAAKLLEKTTWLLHRQRLIIRNLKEGPVHISSTGTQQFLPSGVPLPSKRPQRPHRSSWIQYSSSDRAATASLMGVSAVPCCSTGPANPHCCGSREKNRPLLREEGWEAVRNHRIFYVRNNLQGQ